MIFFMRDVEGDKYYCVAPDHYQLDISDVVLTEEEFVAALVDTRAEIYTAKFGNCDFVVINNNEESLKKGLTV